MLKLFWNTTNTDNLKNQKWGEFHKENTSNWLYSLLRDIQFEEVTSLHSVKADDKLIIVDSEVQEKDSFYSKLQFICKKVYLFHLGDETGEDVKKIYNFCNHTWRFFCYNFYFSSKNISCIPIGYKAGVKNYTSRYDNKKKYKWSFIGTIHKSSRHDLLYQLETADPFFVHTTEKFNDEKGISADEISTKLSQTAFAPCPNGVVHPETYRLYEALECGCIPIVEDSYNYYDRFFPNNPFLKINKWEDAKSIISEYSEKKILAKSKECFDWWINLKLDIKNSITKKLMEQEPNV